ncbi:MAG: hypothetical protein U5K71_03450 [Gracilimonas sp.]|nr:hypothetical protein [Gracilimonas sp.]
MATLTGWYGELEFDLSLNHYNEDVFQLTNESNLSYFSNRHAYMLLNKIKFVNLDGNSLISSGYLHMQIHHSRRQEKLSPETLPSDINNNNLGLNNRALAGAGIKYRFYRSDKWQASVSTRLMVEYEEWQLNEQASIENKFLKSTSNISLRGRSAKRPTVQTCLLLSG